MQTNKLIVPFFKVLNKIVLKYEGIIEENLSKSEQLFSIQITRVLQAMMTF